MKKDIVKNPYLSALGKSLRTISFLAFGIGIILSAVFYNNAAQEKMTSWGFAGDYWYYATLAVAALFAWALATYGVKYPASFLFFNYHAKRTGRARDENPEMMPTMRHVAIVALVSVIAFEGWAAYNGGTITAKMFVPKVEGITDKLAALEQKKAEALAPLRAKVMDVEARMAQDLEDQTKGLQKLLKKNDAWAKGEKAEIEKAIQKKYSTELKNATAALDKETAHWNGVITTATKTDGRKTDADIKQAESELALYGNLLKFAALISLFLGVVMEYALAANEAAKRVRPLTDAEALAIEREREERKGGSPFSAIANAIRGIGAGTAQGAPQSDNGHVGKPMF